MIINRKGNRLEFALDEIERQKVQKRKTPHVSLKRLETVEQELKVLQQEISVLKALLKEKKVL